jgi:hypothetical protein
VQVDKALAAGTRSRFAAGPPGHEDGLCDTPGKMQPGGLSIWRDIPEGDAAENLADGPDRPAAGQPASFRKVNHQRSRRALERARMFTVLICPGQTSRRASAGPSL